MLNKRKCKSFSAPQDRKQGEDAKKGLSCLALFHLKIVPVGKLKLHGVILL